MTNLDCAEFDEAFRCSGARACTGGKATEDILLVRLGYVRQGLDGQLIAARIDVDRGILFRKLRHWRDFLQPGAFGGLLGTLHRIFLCGFCFRRRPRSRLALLRRDFASAWLDLDRLTLWPKSEASYYRLM